MSWMKSLLSALGDGVGGSIQKIAQSDNWLNDEAQLLQDGFMEETFNHDQSNDSTPTMPGTPSSPFSRTPEQDDWSRGQFRDGAMETITSALGAPFRALQRVDRASQDITGDTLFGTYDDAEDFQPKRPNLVGPPDSSQPEESAIDKLASTTAKVYEERDNRQNPNIRQMLRNLKKDSQTDDSNVFVAKGDRVLRGDRSSGNNYIGEGFSKSNRPVVEQEQLRQMAELGMPRQASEAMIDNSSQGEARQLLQQLAMQRMQGGVGSQKQKAIQDVLTDFQKNIAKAENKRAVVGTLQLQLTNLGMSPEEVQQYMMQVLGAQK